jgi:hypothetical protein
MGKSEVLADFFMVVSFKERQVDFVSNQGRTNHLAP